MNDTNVVTIGGRLVKDAETRSTKTGATCYAFSIASGEYKKGEADDTYTNFVDCVYFGKSDGNLKKGAQVTIYGRLHQDRWQNNGQNNSKLRVTADAIKIKSMPKAQSSNSEDYPDVP